MSDLDPSALDVLAIMAHPDDAELLCGGALARSARAGERVGVLDLTRGEMGSWGTVESREASARKAADVLGLVIRRNAGLEDGALENSQESRVRVAGLIRELQPRVVVTHWRVGRHRDHRVAAELVRDASFLAGLKNFPASGDPFRPQKVVYATLFREDAPKPTFVIDITDTIDAKLDALKCYPSQFDARPGMGEVFPAGDRPVYDQIRAHCAVAGSRIRTAYGEPFWTEETVACDTLGTAGNTTF
jgi:bacillithiol biosynthesis deacetylase BshB1